MIEQPAHETDAMELAREGAAMDAIGHLTEVDLDRFGLLAPVKAEAETVDIEDIDYVRNSLTVQADGSFECEGAIYFTCDDGTGETVSDDKPFHVAGRFNGDEVLIESLRLIRPFDHSPLAAAA